MLGQAIKKIQNCYSMESLRDVWAKNAGPWSQLTKDQAAEIIRAKDRRKAEIETGPSYPVSVAMESAILGTTVDVHLWPDHVQVAGVTYSNNELADMKSRGLSAARLQKIHQAKRSFDGEVIPLDQIEKFKPISRGAQL
ncbi:conserved hypothetical protein [delta proteobacterium NaphS2]|nr:conserved hypothetical protein [delta proteobacterium NaphS2]